MHLPADEIVACQNGLLHVPTKQLYAHTPEFFATFAVPFDYDPCTPEPVEWLRFLDQLWGHDLESIDLLQEWFGYIISGSTKQQKILTIVGPIRSGKGTIAKVIRALVGPPFYAAPTLSSISKNFGLQSLIGKTVAVVPDARVDRASGAMTMTVERLLSISGEDVLDIDRKMRDPWTGKLTTRVMILSNELPNFRDATGTLASRQLLLQTVNSFYGAEDTELESKLTAELPGILRWALVGQDQLKQKGRLVSPASSRELERELLDLSSPVGSFVRDCCEVDAAHVVPTQALYEAWRKYTVRKGWSHSGDDSNFAKNLRAVLPRVTTARLRQDDGSQVAHWVGIRLSEENSPQENFYGV